MSSVDNKLPDGWVETTLGKIGTLARGKSKHRPRWAPHLFGGKYPFIQTGQVKSATKYITKYDQTYSEEGLAQSKLWNKNTLCITIAANIAEIGILKFPACFPDSVLGFIANTENADLDFIYYNFSMVQAELRQKSIGSVQDNINLGTFEKQNFIIPPLEEQKAIAKVLTAFDDKIENLQAQNKTLEQTAQTIFKEWFGKYQIGDELPDGWRVGKFGEVIEFINGYAFKSKDLSKEPIDNAYKVFKMGDIKKGGGFNPSKTKGYFSKALCGKLKKYILKNGDLLMSMTDMKDAISLLGHTALMIYEDEYIVNQRVGLIRANNDLNIDYPYLYLLTNNEDFIANLRAGANSGVQVNLSTQGIKDTEFIIADKKINKAFNDLAKPLFEKRKANSLMMKELTKTRDALLPKLMSGAVRVNGFKK